MIVDALRMQLERQEGKRYKAYDDDSGKELKQGDILKGKLTIGIGWNISDVPLPEEIIDSMYKISIQNADDDLAKNLPWVSDMDDVRRDVIRNMCFNMGIKRLLGFGNTLADCKAGNYTSAATRLRTSLWASQVPIRAKELIQQLETGVRR
jgi:lysozyme